MTCVCGKILCDNSSLTMQCDYCGANYRKYHLYSTQYWLDNYKTSQAIDETKMFTEKNKESIKCK